VSGASVAAAFHNQWRLCRHRGRRHAGEPPERALCTTGTGSDAMLALLARNGTVLARYRRVRPGATSTCTANTTGENRPAPSAPPRGWTAPNASLASRIWPSSQSWRCWASLGAHGLADRRSAAWCSKGPPRAGQDCCHSDSVDGVVCTKALTVHLMREKSRSQRWPDARHKSSHSYVRTANSATQGTLLLLSATQDTVSLASAFALVCQMHQTVRSIAEAVR
jgi:hypothetical protein